MGADDYLTKPFDDVELLNAIEIRLKKNDILKKEFTKKAQVFPELCGKDIGLLLETEDYPKKTGGVGTRMVIAGIFQAKTELTASEILDRKTTPEQLEKMVARLRHRPVKGDRQSSSAPSAHDSGSGFDDMDDDIPF